MQVPAKAPALSTCHLEPMKPRQLVRYVIQGRQGRGKETGGDLLVSIVFQFHTFWTKLLSGFRLKSVVDT